MIEVDGDSHGHETQVAKDAARTRYLTSQGYRVLRFWNNDVLGNIEGVMTRIHEALETEAPHP